MRSPFAFSSVVVVVVLGTGSVLYGQLPLSHATKEELIVALKDPAHPRRYLVAQRLGQIKARSAVEPLIDALQDEREEVRFCAAQSLGQIGDPRATDALVGLFGDESYSVRVAAADAAGAMGLAAIDAIGSALEDDDEEVRAAAARALGQISCPRSVDLLIACLKNEGRGGDARRAAAESLGKLKAPRAIEPLIAVFDDVQWKAHAAVTAMGRAALGPLKKTLEHEDPKLRIGAVKALGAMKTPEAIDLVMAAIGDKNHDVRRTVVWVLKESKDPRAARTLEVALDDKDPYVRSWAARALGEVGDAESVEPLIAALRHVDPTLRRAAAVALSQLEDPRSVKPLMKAIEEQPDIPVDLEALKNEDWFKRGYAMAPVADVADERPPERPQQATAEVAALQWALLKEDPLPFDERIEPWALPSATSSVRGGSVVWVEPGKERDDSPCLRS